MKRLFFTLLSAAAISAFVSATPSLAGTGTAATAAAAPAPAPGNGNDARAQAEQALLHPTVVNQYPESEGSPSRQTYGRGYGYNYSSLDAATALVH
jgi:hypothetical protein